jgi:hypothetical protein
MRKGKVKKLALARETLLALDDSRLSLLAGLSPGSNSLNCETVLYASCPPKCGQTIVQSGAC